MHGLFCTKYKQPFRYLLVPDCLHLAQVALLGQRRVRAPSSGPAPPKAKRPRKAAGAAAAPELDVSFIQRDGGLSLFHALGKVLYNKRGEELEASAAGAWPHGMITILALMALTDASSSCYAQGKVMYNK